LDDVHHLSRLRGGFLFSVTWPLRFQAWLSQVDPGNLGAQRRHDWTLLDMRERPGRARSYRSKGFKAVMRALARYRGQARDRQYVGLCHS